jgi:putative spermidine/putrescine transport system substrate-binding protein
MSDIIPTMNRRHLLKTAGGAALALGMPGLSGRAFAATTITVADPGGPFGPAFRKAFYDPFEKATGIKVVNVAREAEPTAQFKAIVETKSYTWDVCTLTVSARDILAKQNLLEPIGFTRDAAPGLMQEALSEHWMGTDVYSTVFAYRNERFKNNAPKTWADFWNVEKFPGRRSLRKNPIDSLEQALMADGVSIDQLYPLDVDRAFKSLDKIKQHVDVWWTGGAQSTQLLQSGEVDLISGWNARLQSAIDGGAPASIVWDQGLYSIEGWAIPKGCPRADAAKQFIKFCSAADRQAAYTEALAYGPTNLEAYKSIAPERAKVLPTSPENLKKMRVANENWWSENRAAVTERFNSWLLT